MHRAFLRSSLMLLVLFVVSVPCERDKRRARNHDRAA